MRALIMLSVPLFFLTLSELRASNGVEIGNAKVDENGGFEIGNGSFANDVYRLKQIIGRWQVDWMKKYAEFTALGGEALRTRAEIDVEKALTILSLEDLNASEEAGTWNPVHIGNAYGIKRDQVSMSGRRQLKYRLFRAPGEVISITLSGPVGTPTNEAFENFQKALEKIEVVSP